jgi:hypothetical protein
MKMTTNSQNDTQTAFTNITSQSSPFQRSTNGSPSPFSNAFDSQDMVNASPLIGLNGQAIAHPCGQHSGGETNVFVFDDTVDATLRLLKDIEKECCQSKQETPISFTDKDAQLLQVMLSRATDPGERKKLEAFFVKFSGNQVERIQTNIQGLFSLLVGKQGFLGIWCSNSKQSLSEMLEQYVVVCKPAYAGEKRVYTTVKCRRLHCSSCSTSSDVRSWTGRWRDAMVCLSSSLQNGQVVWECPKW